MQKILLTILQVVLLINTGSSQCPVQADLWSRLNYLAANSADLKTDQINKQLLELKNYEKQIVNCKYRDDSTGALLFQRIGVMYFRQNNFLEAIRYTNKSINTLSAITGENHSINASLVRNYYNLSLYYGQLKKPREKFAAIDSCVAVAIRLNVPDYYYLYAMSEKLDHLFNIGEYQRCYEFAEIGEASIAKYITGADSIDLVVTFLTFKTNILFFFKNYEKASYLLTNKLQEMQKINARAHYGTIASMFAKMYLVSGNLAKAGEYYRLAVKYNLSSGFNLGAMQSQNNLAYNLYFKSQKDYPKAIDLLKLGLTYRNNDDTYKESQRFESLNLLSNIAIVNVAANRFDSAFRYFQLAFDEIRPGIDENGIKESIEAFVLDKRTNFVTDLVIEKGNAFKKRYLLTKDPSDLKRALRVYTIADQLLARLRKEQSETQSKLFWREQSRKLYEGAIDASLLANDGKSGIYFFEKSRAVLLQDQLSEQSWMGEKDILLQSQAKAKILSLERENSAPDLPSAAKAEIRKQIIVQKQETDRLQNIIKRDNPVYYQNFLDTSFITIRDLNERGLKENQGLLEFFNGDSAVYTMMVRGENITLSKIDKAAFDRSASEYLRYLSDGGLMNRDYPGFITISHRLYRLIFGTYSDLPSRLIVSPDNQYFPFEALVSNTKNGKGADSYLLSTTALNYTYSARFLTTRFRSDNDDGSKDFLGIAPVNFPSSEKLATLLGSKESLEKIIRFFHHPKLDLSKDATRGNFLSNYHQYKIIQLYSHASDSSATGDPVIYFADSSLYLNDLISSQIPKTSLVVLSACKTGSGKLYEGEGVFSFNRQFAALGIPSSVINLWSVDNQSTYRITELFYEYLSKGMASDLALQKAKLEFIRTAPMEKQLPYYWAASILAGKSDVLIAGGRSVWYYLIEVAAIVAVIALLYIVFRKRLS